MSINLIYLPVKNKIEAKHIAKILVKEKLILCANILASGESIYFWQNEIKEEAETYMLLKLKSDKANKVETRIKELHSYEIPAIITIEAKANSEFFKEIL